MSRLEPEFRVNKRTLGDHKGKTVRLTAKVVKIVGDTVTVEASDGGEVAVTIPRDMHIDDKYVEIIGSVREDLTVRALTSINLGPNLDMKAVNAVVEYTHSGKGQGVLA